MPTAKALRGDPRFAAIWQRRPVGAVHSTAAPASASLSRRSSSPNFMAELTDALAATGASIAFDAIGGDKLAGQILTAMEAAVNRKASEYSRYGSATHKQVCPCGMLDPSPTEFNRSFGMAWGMGGWLLFPFLQKIGPAAAQQLRERVAAELKTNCQPLHAHGVAGRSALPRGNRALWWAHHRRQGADQSELGDVLNRRGALTARR